MSLEAQLPGSTPQVHSVGAVVVVAVVVVAVGAAVTVVGANSIPRPPRAIRRRAEEALAP